MNEKNTTTNDQIDEILLRINDMRGFFKFGDEVIPFLGDLFGFLKQVMPLMVEVNTSLQDTALKLPTASDRIEDATKTTEYATTEILDSLDRISEELHQLPGLAESDVKHKVTVIDDEVATIVNALQFQDITSQKLEHANRILEAIYEKFTVLFESLEDTKVSTTIGRAILEAIEEEIDPGKREQAKADFDEKTEDVVRHEQISQDDIDSLFA